MAINIFCSWNTWYFFRHCFSILKEPKRQQNTNTNIEVRSNPIHVLGYIKQRLALFACFMSIFCYLTITPIHRGGLHQCSKELGLVSSGLCPC